jgi:hypothetical protein
MKFGIFYEHQLPQPWSDGAEKRRMWQEAVEQCADMMVMETPTVTARRHRRLPEIGPSHG